MPAVPTPPAPPMVRAARDRHANAPWLVLALLAMLGAGLAQPAASTASLPAIAAGGFDRPERILTMDGLFTSEVAVAPTAADGPLLIWQDGSGVAARPAVGDGPPTPWVETLGVRGVWAGAAGGDPVVAWLERDLATGASSVRVAWRDATRTFLETRERPRIAVVAGASRPILAVALPTPDGWRLGLLDWNGGRRLSTPRPDPVARIDAARDADGIRLAWLEGRDEVALGRVDAQWSAYRALWRDDAPEPDGVVPVGAARVRGDLDVALLGGPDGRQVAFTAPDGVVTVADVDGTTRRLGPGTPLGWLDGRWMWWEGVFVRRSGDAGGTETVLRLPAAPERIAADEAGGVVALVWSTGRFQGGLEVWSANDAEAYRSGPLERFALTMGWDPWRIPTAAGGHLLTALLVALLAAMVFAPIWWLGASLLARRGAASPAAVAVEGITLGILSVIAVIVPVALRIAATGGPGVGLLVAPGWLLAGAIVGALVALALARGRDLEATVGRLLAATLAGSILLAVVAFGTLSAWQRLVTAGA